MEKTFVINLIVCRLAMLVDIESFLFNAFRNTQAMYLVQHFKDNEAHACRPHSYYGRRRAVPAGSCFRRHRTAPLL